MLLTHVICRLAEGMLFRGDKPGCRAGPSFWTTVAHQYQHRLEVWEGPVQSEPVTWDTVPWTRHLAHNAANPLHLGQKLARNGIVRYKVAWIGACVLYDRRKLLDIGGYSFWRELPVEHCGEDVVVQLQLLRRYGGCGILPSGVYHQELPITIPDRQANAADLLLPRLLTSHRSARPNSK